MADALAGRAQVTVLRGEAGVGKSALLGYLSGRVAGWHVARAVGVESEMELAYAGLHQLCAPMLDHLGRLPVPQREALETVFGRSVGAPPDRYLVGLATLTLFAEVAEQHPLACLVDDGQWLDHASAQILGFVARRLLAERIAVIAQSVVLESPVAVKVNTPTTLTRRHHPVYGATAATTARDREQDHRGVPLPARGLGVDPLDETAGLLTGRPLTCAPTATRTRDLLLRRQSLYPLSYRGLPRV